MAMNAWLTSGDGPVRRAALVAGAAVMPRTTEIRAATAEGQDHQAERDPEGGQHLVTTGVRLV